MLEADKRCLRTWNRTPLARRSRERLSSAVYRRSLLRSCWLGTKQSRCW